MHLFLKPVSGVILYVPIRHAVVVFQPNEELNALSLRAVGRGTTIEHVETYAAADFGFGLSFFFGRQHVVFEPVARAPDGSGLGGMEEPIQDRGQSKRRWFQNTNSSKGSVAVLKTEHFFDPLWLSWSRV